jgi:hypothetical protein
MDRHCAPARCRARAGPAGVRLKAGLSGRRAKPNAPHRPVNGPSIGSAVNHFEFDSKSRSVSRLCSNYTSDNAEIRYRDTHENA